MEHLTVGEIVVGITMPFGRVDFGVGVVVDGPEPSRSLSYFASSRRGGLEDGGVDGPDENVVEVESEKSEPRSGVRSNTSGS